MFIILSVPTHIIGILNVSKISQIIFSTSLLPVLSCKIFWAAVSIISHWLFRKITKQFG